MIPSQGDFQEFWSLEAPSAKLHDTINSDWHTRPERLHASLEEESVQRAQGAIDEQLPVGEFDPFEVLCSSTSNDYYEYGKWWRQATNPPIGFINRHDPEGTVYRVEYWIIRLRAHAAIRTLLKEEPHLGSAAELCNVAFHRHIRPVRTREGQQQFRRFGEIYARTRVGLTMFCAPSVAIARNTLGRIFFGLFLAYQTMLPRSAFAPMVINNTPFGHHTYPWEHALPAMRACARSASLRMQLLEGLEQFFMREFLSSGRYETFLADMLPALLQNYLIGPYMIETPDRAQKFLNQRIAVDVQQGSAFVVRAHLSKWRALFQSAATAETDEQFLQRVTDAICCAVTRLMQADGRDAPAYDDHEFFAPYYPVVGACGNARANVFCVPLLVMYFVTGIPTFVASPRVFFDLLVEMNRKIVMITGIATLDVCSTWPLARYYDTRFDRKDFHLT